jgi:hypothetical protein
MAYSDQLAAIVVHAQAAGNALTIPLTDVIAAYPAVPGRCIRIFYGGEAVPTRMGQDSRVLNGQLVAEQIVIMAFWPLRDLRETEAAVLEAEVYNLKHELRTRILGDSQLGGKSTDLDVGYAEPGFAELGGAPYRTLEMIVTTDYIEYPLAP